MATRQTTKKLPRWVQQIIPAFLLTLIVGSSSPWWWHLVFPSQDPPPAPVFADGTVSGQPAWRDLNPFPLTAADGSAPWFSGSSFVARQPGKYRVSCTIRWDLTSLPPGALDGKAPAIELHLVLNDTEPETLRSKGPTMAQVEQVIDLQSGDHFCMKVIPGYPDIPGDTKTLNGELRVVKL